jgi:hypothetical protein
MFGPFIRSSSTRIFLAGFLDQFRNVFKYILFVFGTFYNQLKFPFWQDTTTDVSNGGPLLSEANEMTTASSEK